MRTNIYGEELTSETELVTKVANGRTFYGVRVFLLSPNALHDKDGDDDRSAVTFWVPWTEADGYNFDLVIQMFSSAEILAIEAQEDVTLEAER